MLDNAPAPSESELVEQLQASRKQDPSDNLVEAEETEAVAVAEVEEVEAESIDEAKTIVEEPEEETESAESVSLRTIKDDGVEYEVPEEEFERLASAGHNYTKKVMAHAENVKAFKAESEAELSKLNELTSQLSTLITEQEESVDWDRLAEEDPSEFLVQDRKMKAKQALLEKAQAETKAKAEKQRAEIVNQETEKLREIMGWTGNQEAINKDMAMAGEYMTSVAGITAQEQSNIVDHRIYKMAFDAAKYQELMKNKGRVTEQIKKAPLSVKQGQKPAPNKTEVENAQARVRASGGKSEKDLVAMLKAHRGK